MSSISVNWNGNKVEVIALDFFTCGGEELAVVQSLSGKPFVGGDKWAIYTPFKTVKVSDLIIDQDDECTCKPDGDACPACVRSNAKRFGDDIPFSEATK
jgi:hypothetical protein